jgi:outer membrane protein assembly factor BamB
MRRASVAALIALAVAATAYSDDWPCWRGPNKDGATPENITVWPPHELWSASVGAGMSQVVVSDHRVYTMGFDANTGRDVVYCFNEASGAIIWTKSYDCFANSPDLVQPESTATYGTKSTPTVAGNEIYTVSLGGILNCFNKATGDLLWSVTNNTSKGYATDFGCCGSPLVEGNLVILNQFGHGLAYDKNTGNIVWGTNEVQKYGYASPYAVTLDGQRTIIVLSDMWDRDHTGGGVPDDMRICGVDPATGTILWSAYSSDSITESGSADPIICNGKITYSCCHGGGVYGYQLGSQPQTGGKLTQSWHTHTMEYVNTPVLLNGYIYALDLTSGLPPPQTGLLKCEDPNDGSIKWSSTQSYSDNGGAGSCGAIMVAGGKLVLLSAKGYVSVLDATSTGYTIVCTNVQVNTDYNQSFPYAVPPTIANGIMYVRGTYSTLTAYRVGDTGTGGNPPVITSAQATTGTVGQAFSYQITATGSTPMSYAASGLPAGVNLNTGTGLITGTPTTNGLTSATIRAINTYGTNTATLAITINAVPVAGAAVRQINCGGSAVSPFEADNQVGYTFSGGSPWTTTSNVDLSVSSPAPMAVYQSARYTDNMGYIFSNLTVGVQYKLRLHFADIFNNTVGPRIFEIDVLHGSQVVPNFNVSAAAGGANKAVVKEFTVTPDNSGQIDIWLHAAGANRCEINGIEILTPQAAQGPRISICPKANQIGVIELSWPSDNGTTYAVYRTTNLLSGWPAQPYTNFVGDGSTKTFSDPMATQISAYYRIKASQ